MLQRPWVRALAFELRERLPAGLVPADYVAAQCTLFAKSPETNWTVAPHQDLSIPVAAKIDHADCSGWSRKEGLLFVQPPASLLARLVAIRLHIDACDREGGALHVLPGSHRHGV